MFSLRPLADDDLGMVLEWRNHPNVREHMYTSHVISEEEHRAYFARVKNDPSKEYLICVDEGGVPVGVVNFVDMNEANGTAFWGFYSGDQSRRGVGLQMGYLALKHVFGNLGIRKLNAEVLGTNVVGLRFQQGLGFKVEGVFKHHHLTNSGYVDVYRLGMFGDDWFNKWQTLTEERLRKAVGGNR